MRKLVLASSSPRRKELLAYAKIPFTIMVSEVDEDFDPNKDPKEIAQDLALQKAKAVFNSADLDDAVVIGADTIVTVDNQILGKPKDAEEAKNMLKMLSGREHVVITGVAIVSSANSTIFYEETKVQFWDLTDEEIEDYIKSGEPFDKAGSYGIQNLGSILVKKIDGDYFNVVGLPIARTYRELKKFFP
ncbi:Maf family protein [Calidifontibacillus erzurumensis]|uniref:dTTP/UTP pyrophosphatase n=1 Tax=Calidifontibacillus erzurumensis TaxID=2741433 RepID=A0A8J8GDZ3_9BACI|nr:Maf family protein [Calidifontibacillus erzurumensis]NSL51612.1 septum formation inhibitor Maf [Calidifontibacillus erzurumensis]